MSTAPGVLTPDVRLRAAAERAAQRLGVRLAIFAALSLIISEPLLETAPAMNFFRDAQVLMSYEQAAVRSVVEYFQPPLWDPYYCGGVYLLGTPQSRFVSPTFVLSLLFGPLRAESLTVFAMLIVGLEGAWRYAVSRGASAFSALAAAPVFAASGVFAAAPPLGWFNFFGFELIPWALAGLRYAARGDPRGAVTSGVSLAWIVGFGGTYAAPMSALLCAWEVAEGAIGSWRSRKTLLRGLLGIFAAATLAFGLSMVRLWPIAESLADAPRVIADAPGMTWSQVQDALVGHREATPDGVRWVQGSFMVGALAIPAVLLGLTRVRSISLVLMAGVSAWLATGYAYPGGPFRLLRHVPVFSVLRYPERYLIFVALAACVLAAFGVDRAMQWGKARRGWYAVSLLLVAALIANTGLAVQHHYRLSAPRDLLPAPATIDRPFQQARGNRWALGFYGPMSRGSLSCWDAYPIPQSALLRSDLAQDEYLADGVGGRVERLRWSPNLIELRVKLDKPGRLYVNQNWHAGWRSNVGAVVSDDGLLAVDLPPGEHVVSLRFVPRSAVGGALATVVAIAVGWWTWRHGRDALLSRRKTLIWVGALLAPMAAAGAVRGVMPQAAAAPRVLRGTSGDPIVADALPEGANKLGVAYGDNVELAAASVTPASVPPGGSVKIELYWRAVGPVKPGVGVYVHVQPSDGAFINRDHNLISATLELSDAPVGKLLRDVVVVSVPPSARPGTWTVWTGLWMSRGDGSRVPIVSHGLAEVVDGRAKAAMFTTVSAGK